MWGQKVDNAYANYRSPNQQLPAMPRTRPSIVNNPATLNTEETKV
jgi:hypothetical protein